MSTVAVHRGRLPGHRRWFDPARIAAGLKFVRDVFVEAQAMAREAKRRYPYFE